MSRAIARTSPSAMQRWLRFNFVGLIGVGVQLAVLQALISLTAMNYRWATLLAVEITVLHNFVWHLRFTWRERLLREANVVIRRMATFHLTNGIVSLAGSWTLMTLLVGRTGIPVIVANVVSIAACSVVNFLLAEVLVFRGQRRGRRRVRPLHSFNKHAYPCERSGAFSLHSACGDR